MASSASTGTAQQQPCRPIEDVSTSSVESWMSEEVHAPSVHVISPDDDDVGGFYSSNSSNSSIMVDHGERLEIPPLLPLEPGSDDDMDSGIMAGTSIQIHSDIDHTDARSPPLSPCSRPLQKQHPNALRSYKPLHSQFRLLPTRHNELELSTSSKVFRSMEHSPLLLRES